MKLTCPSCHAPIQIDAATQDADAHRVIGLTANLPAQIGTALMSYIGLFRSENGALAWSRVHRLIKELDQPIRDQSLSYKRKAFYVPHSIWAEAMHNIASRPASLKLPLTSHGYLYSVVTSASSRLADKARADEETKQHQKAAGRRREAGNQSTSRQTAEGIESGLSSIRNLLGGVKNAEQSGLQKTREAATTRDVESEND